MNFFFSFFPVLFLYFYYLELCHRLFLKREHAFSLHLHRFGGHHFGSAFFGSRHDRLLVALSSFRWWFVVLCTEFKPIVLTRIVTAAALSVETCAKDYLWVQTHFLDLITNNYGGGRLKICFLYFLRRGALFARIALLYRSSPDSH